MFTKSTGSLRKKVKYIKQKLYGEEEDLQAGASQEKEKIPASDGASEPSPKLQPIPHRPDRFIEELFLTDNGLAPAPAGPVNNVKHGHPRLKEANATPRDWEGDVLKAGNAAKGKGVRVRDPKDEDEKAENSKTNQPGDQKEKQPRKYNTWGRIKVRSSTRTNSFSDSSIASGPGSIVDGNTVFRKWPDSELVLQREVIEKYAAGRKLWTRESLIEIERRISDENPVRLEAYAGPDEVFEKQPGSDAPPPSITFLSPRTAKADTLTRRSRVTYMAEFHGYQDLAYPPPSRANGKPYCSVSIRAMPVDYSREKSLKNGLDTFHHYMAYWLGHPLGKMFTAMFMKLPLPPSIDKIVCIDLGSITGKNADTHGYVRRAIYKHAAAMSAVEAVHRRFGTRIRLLVQDTAYCSECAELLYAKGFGVVGEHGAQGLAEVDDRTLLFAPTPRFCLKEIIADVAEPAAMFWGTVRSPEETENWTRSIEPVELDDKLMSYYHEHEVNPDTPRVREFIKKYTRHSFPTNNLFGAVSLYARTEKCAPQIQMDDFSKL